MVRRLVLLTAVLTVLTLPAFTPAARAQWGLLLGKDPRRQIAVVSDRDPLPPGALLRLGSQRLQHAGKVKVAFSRDGKQLFSAGADNRFCVWSTVDGRELRSFSKDGLSFLPPSRPIPAGSHGGEMFFNGRGMVRRHYMIMEEMSLGGFAVAPDGQTLAILGDKKIDFWDTAGGTLRQSLDVKQAAASAFSADSKLVAISEQDERNMMTIKVNEWTTGKEVHKFQSANHGGVNKLIFSGDGKFLAAADNSQRGILVWNLATGKRIRNYQGVHWGSVDIALPHTGNLMASAGPGRLVVWEFDSDEEAAALGNDGDSAASVAFSPQDSAFLASSGVDRIIRIWNWRANKVVRQWETGEVYESLTFSPDGNLLAGTTSEGRITLWIPAAGKEIVANRIGEIGVINFERETSGRDKFGHDKFGRDTKLWALETDGGRAVEFREKKGSSEGTWEREILTDGIENPAFANNPNAILMGGLEAWRFPFLAVEPRLKITAAGPKAMDAAMAQFGGRFPGNRGEGGKLTLASALTGKTLAEVDAAHGVAAQAFSPDGKFFAFNEGDEKGLLRIIKVDGGKESRRWEAGHMRRLLYTPDGQTLAALDGDNRLILWEVASAERRGDFLTTISPINVLEFSPDGKLLAAACQDETVRLWDVASGKLLRAMVGHQGQVLTLAFQPDGKALASGGNDGSVCLWRTADGHELSRFTGHRGAVNHLAFDDSGKRLVSTAKDATVVIWDATKRVKPAALVENRLLEGLFNELGLDAAAAFRAAAALAARPDETIKLFRARIPAAASLPPEQMEALIRDLESDVYATREKATKTLERLDALAEPHLVKALAANPGAELEKRLQTLMEKLKNPERDPEKLRRQRAVEVLERIGSAHAQELLAEWSKGAPDARLTRLATAARLRLAKRSEP